jgi:hypothetical protein
MSDDPFGWLAVEDDDVHTVEATVGARGDGLGA